jgi:two-component system, LytTR family, response regulator LytT
MKLKCIVLDDEYLAIRVIKSFAEQTETLEVANTFTNPAEALSWVAGNTIDLIFSDIQMPGLNGIDFVKHLPYKPAVIFTTARQDFAMQAYELDVIDYLVKPISPERFSQAVQKAADFIAYKKMNNGNKQQTGYLHVRADYKIIQIPHHEILMIEGLSEYVKIHTTEKTHIVLTALKNLAEELPPSDFIRIHKSYIISRQYIASYNSTAVQTTNNVELPVGRTYKHAFLEFMAKQ